MSVRYPCLYYPDWSSFERRREYVRQRLMELDRYSLRTSYELYSKPLLRELDELYDSWSYYHYPCYRLYNPHDYNYELSRALETNRRLEREIQLLKSRTDESLIIKNRELEEQLLKKSRELDEVFLSKEKSEELQTLRQSYDELQANYNRDVRELHQKYNNLNTMHLELMDTHNKEKYELQQEMQSLKTQVDNQIEINESLKNTELKKTPIKKRRASVRGKTPTGPQRAGCDTCVRVHKHEWAKVF